MDGQGELSQITNHWGFLALDIDTRLDVINHQYYHNGQWVGSHQTPEALFDWIHQATETLLAKNTHHALQASGINTAEGTVAPALASVPFQQGWFSCWGYETHTLLEPALHQNKFTTTQHSTNPFEGLRLCWFNSILAWHKPSNTFYAFGVDAEKLTGYLSFLTRWQPPLSNETPDEIAPFSQAWLTDYHASFSADTFAQAVCQVKTHIEQGDLYQANLSIQWQRNTLELSPLQLFESLCTRNPSPFAGLFKTPQGWVLSNSPERLVRCDSTGKLETRPIAGTRGRGKNAAEDDAIIATLLTNEKERAEHLMLVDLERNDLGRVCQVGSVIVDDLLAVERYSHVTHLVSNVTGQKLETAHWLGVLQALFPGGTITGCPKIRCIETLSQLEPVSRGAYTGSFGFVDVLQGTFDFNILIRTITLLPTHPMGLRNVAACGKFTVLVQAGAGIVQDSVAANEYKETLRKASALFEVLHKQTSPT
jgi:anthranilate/para-aminobenzoate synthase component I